MAVDVALGVLSLGDDGARYGAVQRHPEADRLLGRQLVDQLPDCREYRWASHTGSGDLADIIAA